MSTSRSTVPSRKRASQTYFRRRPKDSQRLTDMARIATGTSPSLTLASSQGEEPPLPIRGMSGTLRRCFLDGFSPRTA